MLISRNLRLLFALVPSLLGLGHSAADEVDGLVVQALEERQVIADVDAAVDGI